MKKILLLAVWFAGFQCFKANAAITVTPATGGTGICARLAVGGGAPAFTTLGTITVTEGLVGDITNGFHLLILTPPAGWQFNPASTMSFGFTPGRNITAVASGGITTTSLTVVVNVTGTTLLDALTINGLQVQATSTAAAAGNITASSATGMTGIIVAMTPFAPLSLTPVLTPSVTIGASPAGTICSGTNVTFTAFPINGGTPTYQWFVNGLAISGATNVTFSSSTLAAGNTVRVQMNATGCVNPASVASPITSMAVTTTPAAVTVGTAGTYCNNTTLTASIAGGGTIFFQDVVSNGTSTATPSASEIIVTPGTHTYYFRARQGTCWGPEGSAKVTINMPPSAITITPATTATLCMGESATFVADAIPSDVDVLQEDFNAGLGGWTIDNIAGVAASFWQVRNSPGYNGLIPGDGSPYIEAAPDATGSAITTNTLFTSPSFSLVGYSAASLSFNQYFQTYAADATVAVEYSTDGGASWIPFIDQLGLTTGLVTWVSTSPTTSVALPAGAIGQPNVQIRWNYVSTWGWYWAVDNIAVRATPTPDYLWAGVSGATGLSCTSCTTVDIAPAMSGVNVYSVVSSVAGCAAVAGVTITVNPLPSIYTVSGDGSYCATGTGVNVVLSGSEAGVDYQLFDGATMIGLPMSGTGTPLDFGPQTLGTYTVLATNTTTGCSVAMTDDAVITEDPLPDPIAGLSDVCVGSTITLTDATTGGMWSSSDVLVATVDAMTGVVTGMNAGVADITYTLPTGCAITHSVTVNALPVVAPITGPTNLCVGTTGTLASTTPGGTWTSDGPTTASIDPVTGLVNAIAAGTTIISYTVTDGFGCTASVWTDDTVTALPVLSAIAGPASVCLGSSTTFTNSTAGGTWSSSDPAIGSIDPSTGLFDAISTGSVTITYTAGAASCTAFVTHDVEILALPVVDPITGSSLVCAGMSIALSNTTPDGVWSSSDAAVATISSGGVVSGVSAGMVTISYTVTTIAGCSDFVTYSITVGNALPTVGILPAGAYATLCNGDPTNLVATVAAGITYQWSTGGTDIAGATNNSFMATTPGIYTLVISNGTCSLTLPSKTVLPDPNAVISYNTTGNLLYTGSFATYQWFRNGVEIPGATTGLYLSPVPGDYTVVVADITGCTDTSDIYTIMTTGLTTPVAGINVKVYPNPASSVIYIDAPVKVSVTVMAADGRVVSENKEATSINVSSLANGVYMLLIYDEHKTLLRTDRFSKVD